MLFLQQSDWTRNCIHWQTDHWYHPGNWCILWLQKWDMNDPYRLSLTVVYGSIYSKVEDYKTENKTHTNTEYKQEKMAAASILPWSHSTSHSFWNSTVAENWVAQTYCLPIHLQKIMPLTDFWVNKKIIHGKSTEHLHFPISSHFWGLIYIQKRLLAWKLW